MGVSDTIGLKLVGNTSPKRKRVNVQSKLRNVFVVPPSGGIIKAAQRRYYKRNASVHAISW